MVAKKTTSTKAAAEKKETVKAAEVKAAAPAEDKTEKKETAGKNKEIILAVLFATVHSNSYSAKIG